MGSELGRDLINAFPYYGVSYYNESSDEEADEDVELVNTNAVASTMQPVNGSQEAMNAIMELGESKLNEGDYIALSNYLKVVFNDLQTNPKPPPILGTNRIVTRRILVRNPNIVFELTPDEQVEIMQSRYKQHYRDSIDELIERMTAKYTQI